MIRTFAQGFVHPPKKAEELELKEGNNGYYVRFDIAALEGYGEYAYTEWKHCIVFGDMAEKIVKAKVKKGSTIFVWGKPQTKVFEKDGVQRQYEDLTVLDWGYMGGGSKKVTGDTSTSSKEDNGGSIGPIDGEVTIGDDEDLPF